MQLQVGAADAEARKKALEVQVAVPRERARSELHCPIVGTRNPAADKSVLLIVGWRQPSSSNIVRCVAHAAAEPQLHAELGQLER
eukprot:5430221-Prymnesium_polylepis.1